MTKRIEFIDSMRGFAMILVILGHVVDVMFQAFDIFSWSHFTFIFHIPLFFFISGFVLYKATDVWSWRNSAIFVKKKFVLLVVPTIVFFAFYVYINNLNLLESITHRWKVGFWFTYILFFYYVLYAFLSTFLDKVLRNVQNWIKITLLLFIGLCLTLTDCKTMNLFIEDHPLLKILSIPQYEFFIFFILGAIVRKYYNSFLQYIDKNCFITSLLVCFIFTYTLFNQTLCGIWGIKLKFVLWGIMCVFIIFAYFKKHEELFSRKTIIGRSFQYIGKRTLDIYLLHCFFISNTWGWMREFWLLHPNPTIELFVSIIVSLMVLALSLLTSSILRLSPFLSHFLFGVK